MTEFVLVVILTMGLGKEPSSFEIRLPKETYKKCIEDSKTAVQVEFHRVQCCQKLCFAQHVQNYG